MPTLHRVDEEIPLPDRMPAVALRDLVFFPYLVLPLLIGRPDSVAALAAAEDADGVLLLITQRDAGVDSPGEDDLYRVGTVARVLQTSALPDGTWRVVLEGLGRAEALTVHTDERGHRAEVRLLEAAREQPHDPVQHADLARDVRRLYEEYLRSNRRLPDELLLTLSGVEDLSRLVNLMSGHLLLGTEEKQRLLETVGVGAQLDALRDLLERELEVLRIEERLGREALRDPEQERPFAPHATALGEMSEVDDEIAELERAIADADLPEGPRERADRELRRLARLSAAAPEASVIRTYLEWILALPWTYGTVDALDVDAAATILDEGHHGLHEVRDRILDHIAVLGLVGRLQGPILCLVGPPGVGKTSLGESIARALERRFVRASLGGVRDEAEIRGHRRTYVGAMPGRILQGMRRAGSRNPVFLLDEVDKLARDAHGDPGAALLEVLDPEQNSTFMDHYLELGFDLSDVLFVATANTLTDIPGPLRDRMEVIRLSGYLETEKRVIARRFLWPRQAERHGLDPERVAWSDHTLDHVLSHYTREAGVRELEQRMARVARKIARDVAANGSRSPAPQETLSPDRVRAYLGPPTYSRTERENAADRTGIAHGLAWTASGGEVLDVEVAAVRGSGQIRLTGTLGDVMKESAFAAMTYARARSPLLGLDEDFHERLDIHIHLPEGATPKDGPSAGITIAVALISALTGIPTRPDVALTGEITLRGRVLPVGGLKEKAVAALRERVATVVVPALNDPDLQQLPDEVREGLTFIRVRTMDQVLEAALAAFPSGPLHPGTGSGLSLSQ